MKLDYIGMEFWVVRHHRLETWALILRWYVMGLQGCDLRGAYKGPAGLILVVDGPYPVCESTGSAFVTRLTLGTCDLTGFKSNSRSGCLYLQPSWSR